MTDVFICCLVLSLRVRQRGYAKAVEKTASLLREEVHAIQGMNREVEGGMTTGHPEHFGGGYVTLQSGSKQYHRYEALNRHQFNVH